MPFAYPAIFSRQRKNEGAPLSACFTAPVGEIRRWTNIDRLSTTGKGHQRVENASKVKTIRRFLELDERNTIPNALTVALRLDDFREPVLNGCATLHIPDNDPPLGVVIDGQQSPARPFDATGASVFREGPRRTTAVGSHGASSSRFAGRYR